MYGYDKDRYAGKLQKYDFVIRPGWRGCGRIAHY